MKISDKGRTRTPPN